MAHAMPATPMTTAPITTPTGTPVTPAPQRPNWMFGLAIGAMSLGWITVVVVALVRERWIRRDGSEPQLDR